MRCFLHLRGNPENLKRSVVSMINMVKLPTKKSNLFLRVAKGHFATSHSHINYYIDVTTQKSRLSEAKAVAKELVSAYQHNTIVDTVLCLDGTQVIGTCLANELTKDGFANMNAHQTIYVITPEYTTGSQIILRDNLAPMVKGKHVLILAASITTGYTVQAAVEAVNYYGGTVAGLSAIFATTHECMTLLNPCWRVFRIWLAGAVRQWRKGGFPRLLFLKGMSDCGLKPLSSGISGQWPEPACRA